MPPTEPKGESFAALFETEAGRTTPRRRSLSVGEEIDVIVVQIGRDAVFVELDGKQEGFIESKDLTNKVGELTVKLASRIHARVAETGGREGAVRLVPVFVRPPVAEEIDADPLPIEGAAGSLSVGSRVTGSIAVVERYGVFLQIVTSGAAASKRGTRGLIPTAELGVPRGADLHKLFPVGTELEAKIIGIDERGRIKLSVVALNVDAERREYEEHRSGSKAGAKNEPVTRGFGTLGDLFAKRNK